MRQLSKKPGRGYGPLIKAVVGIVLALMILAVVGMYAVWRILRVEPIESDTPTAVARFTEVLNGNAELEQDALRHLAGAIQNDPTDARARLWFGLANMFIFIQTDQLPYAIRTSQALTTAVSLDPSNKSAEGWRAFFEYMAARNRGRDLDKETEALVAAGRADPRFSSFLVAIALADRPLSTGLPQQVLGPLEAAGDCGDGTTYTCRTTGLHPHAAEGYHATLGDLKVRLGDLEGGRAEYQKALSMKSAQTWPYRAAFDKWVDEAPARASRFMNASDEDDPPVFFAHGRRACLACHEH